MSEIIRFNSADKDIAAVKCYVRENLNGSPLYRDEDRTELIPKEEAIELFNKGLITVECGDSHLLNAKPMFITDGEIGDISLDEEAGYGVIFFIGNDDSTSDDSEVVTCYVNEAFNGSPLYRDSNKTEIIPKEEAIELFNKGLIVVDYGGSDGLMNCKPMFITDFELSGAEFVEGAEYGVVFYIPTESDSFYELYMNVDMGAGPTGMLYTDSSLTDRVSFDTAVDYVRNGNAIVKAYQNDRLIFAGKPTCVVLSDPNSDEYEVKFPLN